MSEPDFVTPAHLEAVRGEVHALIGQHRAEVAGELIALHGGIKALDAKLDASRSAQEAESIGLRGTLERLTTEVRKTTIAVDAIESGDEKATAVRSALDDFTGRWGRRLLTGATLIVMVLGVLVAYTH